MSIQRDTIPFGPAKLVFGATNFHSAGDVDVEVLSELADVANDQYGQGVKTLLDQTVEVTCRPQSLWSLLTSVLPNSHIAPTIGTRLIGASPTPLVLHGEDSHLLTIHAACITQLPSLSLGVDKGEFGPMKFTGVVTNAKSPGEAGALLTYAATGGTYGTPSDPDYLAAAQWDAAWDTAVLAGTLLEAVNINPDLKIEPVKAGSRTLDFRVMGIQFSADLVAAFSLTDLAGLFSDGATFSYGQRNTAQGADLVLTSGLGHTFTLAAAALEKAALRFAMKEGRNREVSFRTTPLTGARISWTTPV